MNLFNSNYIHQQKCEICFYNFQLMYKIRVVTAYIQHTTDDFFEKNFKKPKLFLHDYESFMKIFTFIFFHTSTS